MDRVLPERASPDLELLRSIRLRYRNFPVYRQNNLDTFYQKFGNERPTVSGCVDEMVVEDVEEFRTYGKSFWPEVGRAAGGWSMMQHAASLRGRAPIFVRWLHKRLLVRIILRRGFFEIEACRNSISLGGGANNG